MRKEYSYGIIPLKKKEREWQVFLVQHSRALFWGYPKGHSEGKESPLDAALRELKEETALELVKLLREEPFEEHYFFMFKGEKIFKTVQLFVAEVTGTPKLQKDEISAGQWLSLNDAKHLITYPTDRHILERAIIDCSL